MSIRRRDDGFSVEEWASSNSFFLGEKKTGGGDEYIKTDKPKTKKVPTPNITSLEPSKGAPSGGAEISINGTLFEKYNEIGQRAYRLSTAYDMVSVRASRVNNFRKILSTQNGPRQHTRTHALTRASFLST